jgi:hypothetical protein
MSELTPLVRELEGFIDSAQGGLSNASFFAKTIAPDLAKSAIERNHAIMSIAYNEDLETRIPLYQSTVAGFVSEDFEAQSMVTHIHTVIKQVEMTLKSARTVIDSFGEAEANNVRSLRSQVASLTSQVQAFSERVKMHAIHDERVREQVWEVTGGKCFYCECELVRGPKCEGDSRANVFHVDHLVPKSAGGPDHLTNYVPSCQTCNISKSDKPVAVFMASRRQPKLTLVASS